MVAPAMALAMLAGAARAQNTEIASAATNSTIVTSGALGNLASAGGCVTPNGRWVVFQSQATNLVTGDTNGRTDIFVRDLWTNVTTRVSLPDPGQPDTQSNEVSFLTAGQRTISDNGRFVIFTSHASNLVANDTNGVQDVFVRDRDLDGNGTMDEPGEGKTRTVRVSVTTNEGQANGPCPNDICDHFSENGVISASGRYVAWQSSFDFTSDPAAFQNVYWRDRDADNDGIFDESGGSPDAAVTRMVSRRINGSQFVGQTGDGFSGSPTISGNGRWVGFVSQSRFMVFSDTVSNQEVFARDMFTDSGNVRLSEPTAGGQPDGSSSTPFLSGTGRFVAFISSATNLAPNNAATADAIVKDRDTDGDGTFDELGGVAFDNASRTFNAFSLPDGIVFLNDSSLTPSISDDGRYVAFASAATNFNCGLIGGCVDQNAAQDVFVFDRTTERLTRASVTASGAEASGASQSPALSGGGRFVYFSSDGLAAPARAGAVRALLPMPNTTCAAGTTLSAGQTLQGDTYAGPGDAAAVICDASRANTAWFTFTAQCSGQVTFSTAGSSFDTVVAVYAGCAGASLGCNDDANAGAGVFTSELTVTVAAGETYSVRVGGFATASGRFTLTASACEAFCPADFDMNGIVNPDDLADFIAAYFSTPPEPRTDYDGNNIINPDDLADFIAAYFTPCN
jgi:hypothetical protein